MDLEYTKEEVHVLYINSTNKTNNISINDDANVFLKYYARFLSPNNKKYVSTGT